MQHANNETVLGDFSDTSFNHLGTTTRFYMKDGKHFVHTEGPDARPQEFEVKFTFGVDPLQQYLIELPGGRLQAFNIAWDTRPIGEGGQRWFHLYPEETPSTDSPFHWTGIYQNWNAICADCHSTNLKKNYDPNTDAYATSWSEINVSCQACHGPGETHVAWAQALSEGQGGNNSDNGLGAEVSAQNPDKQIEICARCHSRRSAVSDSYSHSGSLLDSYQPSPLSQEFYYPDGQIMDEVYVYGSFLQSKMYQAGVTCTDCHNPHTAQLKLSGNSLCMTCHQESPPAQFPNLKAKLYDSPAHHFHPPGSEGAKCVNCHMPAKTYMIVDPRRDHSFRIPRPDLSRDLGVPNACNQCHQDQPVTWAINTLEKWYGRSRPKRSHFAYTLAAARNGERDAQGDLIKMIEAGQHPDIVLATALDVLRQYPLDSNGIKTVIQATQSDNPLVRREAASALEAQSHEVKARFLTPLLTDPVRAVRTEAARMLTSIPTGLIRDPSDRKAFGEALKEYLAVQDANADLPASQLNRAVIFTNAQRFEAAEEAYVTALKQDPAFVPASLNLANLYNTLNRNNDAEQVLREAIRWNPDEGEVHYSLGLVLGEEQRFDDAAEALRRAADLMPDRARVRYNQGLVLQRLGRLFEADVALNKAHQVDPNDPDIVYALTVFYVQQGNPERARSYAEKLAVLSPGMDPDQLLQQIEQTLK